MMLLFAVTEAVAISRLQRVSVGLSRQKGGEACRRRLWGVHLLHTPLEGESQEFQQVSLQALAGTLVVYEAFC